MCAFRYVGFDVDTVGDDVVIVMSMLLLTIVCVMWPLLFTDVSVMCVCHVCCGC